VLESVLELYSYIKALTTQGFRVPFKNIF